jgi:hypothetical protein
MDKFVANILVLFNKIETDTITLFNNKVRDKQYLTYYLYRIWIKYRVLFESIVDKKEYLQVLGLLGIPKKYQNLNFIYPMINKMPYNMNILNQIIEIINKHINEIHKTYINNPTYKDNKDIKKLNDLLITKELKNIIEDIIQIRLLVPNLSLAESRQKIWERVLPVLDEYSQLKKELKQ